MTLVLLCDHLVILSSFSWCTLTSSSLAIVGRSDGFMGGEADFPMCSMLGMLPLASPRSAYAPLLPLGLQLGSPPHGLYLMTLCPCPDYHHRRHHHDSTPPLLRISNLGDGRESSIWSGSPSLALRLWPWEHSQKNRTSL